MRAVRAAGRAAAGGLLGAALFLLLPAWATAGLCAGAIITAMTMTRRR